LHISEFAVKEAVQRFMVRHTFEDLPRSGRPLTVTKRDKRHVKYCAAKKMFSSAIELTNVMKTDFNVNVNRQHVRESLQEAGFYRVSDRTGPPITEKWKKTRREFYLDNLSTNWKHVSFSDEKTFRLKKSGRLKFYARSYEEFQEKHHEQPWREEHDVRVWGVITAYGTGPLLPIPRGINTKFYVSKILEPILSTGSSIVRTLKLPRSALGDFIWQQDNASFHTGPAAKQFFRKHDINVIAWPTYSPDLSPIENVWNMIQYQLRKQQIESGPIKDTFAAIKEIWDSITPAQCYTLVMSMPDRLNELYRRQYNIIDY
jgi:transposase